MIKLEAGNTALGSVSVIATDEHARRLTNVLILVILIAVVVFATKALR